MVKGDKSATAAAAASETMTPAKQASFLASERAKKGAAAAAGKGKEGTPCGAYFPAVKCENYLCCGYVTYSAEDTAKGEKLLGVESTKVFVAF